MRAPSFSFSAAAGPVIQAPSIPAPAITSAIPAPAIQAPSISVPSVALPVIQSQPVGQPLNSPASPNHATFTSNADENDFLGTISPPNYTKSPTILNRSLPVVEVSDQERYSFISASMAESDQALPTHLRQQKRARPVIRPADREKSFGWNSRYDPRNDRQITVPYTKPKALGNVDNANRYITP
ncbi:hypothetical protein BLNAU_930 [Blattamonas nauphoetae]|uniref:Uncharacterized protein n=1 Tax=Blattamonas nauphoetae TaxID=2049346 RepID=A0ABQ9YJE1_9EUKA|nr:hypothetical protein BLNAU_930 [Blattamonas nauphoetae]